jgi:hypothetical protein
MINSWGFFIFYPIPLIVVDDVKCFPGLGQHKGG